MSGASVSSGTPATRSDQLVDGSLTAARHSRPQESARAVVGKDASRPRGLVRRLKCESAEIEMTRLGSQPEKQQNARRGKSVRNGSSRNHVRRANPRAGHSPAT